MHKVKFSLSTKIRLIVKSPLFLHAMWHVLLAGWPFFQHRVHQTGFGGPWLLLVSQQRVWWPLQILTATHGGQRGAGRGLVWGIVQMPHHV